MADQPAIAVPTLVVDPTGDSIARPRSTGDHRRHFPHLVDHRPVAAGHNLPQEAPGPFADAVRAVLASIGS